MKIIQTTLMLVLALVFTSCTSLVLNMGWVELIVLFVVLISLFVLMFILIQRQKNKGEKSLAAFSASISMMLEKYDNPESKIRTLLLLIERIKEDEKYKKDTSWQDKVLAKTYLHLATQYNVLGDAHNTLAVCSKILELTPDDAMTLYNRGSLYSNLARNNEALQDLTRSIELVDDYASSYNNRGMVLTRLHRYDEAMQDFDKALELEESAIIYYNRGNTLKEQNRVDKSLASYEKALALCDEEDSDLIEEINNAIKGLPSNN